jgi:ribonuclease HI
MDTTESISIFTDGGSRGNPGPAAIGVYIEDNFGRTLDEIGKTIGINTNNVAEYQAIVRGLDWIIDNKHKFPNLRKIQFFMDSNLAASQLNGIYKIKNAVLRELLFSAKTKEAEIGLPISYSFVPREKNKNADKLVNMALDNKLNFF